MLDRNHIETLLRIHGMSPTSSDEEIRSVLLSARYNAEEIETAMTVLRQNTINLNSRVEGLHKIFRTDNGLAPKEVSELLGIDVDVSDAEIKNHRRRELTTGQNFIVLGIALGLAFSSVLYAMYVHEAGPFHPSTKLTNR